MFSAFHKQLAFWNAVVLVVLVAVFGVTFRSLAVWAFVAFVFAVIGVRHHLAYTGPLHDLTASIRRGSTLSSARFMTRGPREVRDLAAEIEARAASTSTRIKDLSDARVWLESILRAMVEGVLVFDRDGRITLANDAVVRLLEIPRDPRGKTCLEVFRNEVLHGSVQHVLRGSVLDRVEFQTGSGRHVRVLMAPIVGDAGRTEAAVAVLHDMTDERQADRVRRDFVANVSHEFKTPLTSIRGYAETIQGESESLPHKEFASIILRNAEFLETMVNGLLELARMESQPSPPKETFDIRTVVHDQVALRQHLAEGVTLIVEEARSPVWVNADRARLGTALSNLVDNAIRYNRTGGTVRVHARVDGSHVMISVTDDGFGIPEKDLSRVFERFYRVDKARSRDSGGTGLGLAIARHAIESQGGTLSVTSKLGSGSTFSIRIPASRPAPKASVGHGPPAGEPESSPRVRSSG